VISNVITSCSAVSAETSDGVTAAPLPRSGVRVPRAKKGLPSHSQSCSSTPPAPVKELVIAPRRAVSGEKVGHVN
jgi:hypothetical protein